MLKGRAAEALIWAMAFVPPVAAAGEPEELRDDRGGSLLPSAGPDTLLLEWLDVGSATVGVDGIARSETSAILKEAGIIGIWRRGDGGEAGRPGEVRVILVDRLQVRPDSGRPILGAAPRDLRKQPFVWIHLRSVRAALGLGLRHPSQSLPVAARRDLGIAVGRVIAHEVVHALAPSLHHGEELMSECLEPWDLSGPRPSVGSEAAAAVRTALRRRTGAPAARVAGGGVGAPSGAGISARPGREEAGRDLAPRGGP